MMITMTRVMMRMMRMVRMMKMNKMTRMSMKSKPGSALAPQPTLL